VGMEAVGVAVAAGTVVVAGTEAVAGMDVVAGDAAAGSVDIGGEAVGMAGADTAGAVGAVIPTTLTIPIILGVINPSLSSSCSCSKG
jgi:hypothetical protein